MNNNNYTEQMYGPPQENEQGRVPPQAVEVEQNILGGMIMDEEAALGAFEILKAKDFYKPVHQTIFDTFFDLFMDDKPLEMTVIESELRDRGSLDAVGGSGYLTELTRMASSSANIEYHADIVAKKSKKRQLIQTCTDVIKEAYQSDTDTMEVLEKAESKIFDLAQEKGSEEAKHIGDHLQSVLEQYENLKEDPDSGDGMMCGLDIDDMLTGFKPGNLYILAARPSMGKTACVLRVAKGLANNGYPPGIFSLEMSGQSVTDRLITMESKINGQKARKGEISDEEFKRMIDASGRLYEHDIYVDDTPGISIMQMRSKARHMVQKQGVKIIIVDYLQLMTYSGNVGTREQEITKISQGLQALGRDMNVPVIALSQLSRAVEQRGGDKRPQLSDLRESGSIEQDADAVMFLYRPEYYGIETTPGGESTKGLAEVLIKKQRNGPTGTSYLYFQEEYANFENQSTQYHEQFEDEETTPF